MPRKTNVEINGKSYFRVTATIGKDSNDNPIRKQFYGASKKEAEAKRDEYMSNINKGLSANFDKAVFKHVFDTWFEHVLRPTIKPSTYYRYHTEYRLRIENCVLSSMKLSEIKPINLQGYFNGMLETCSIDTAYYIRRWLSYFFDYCMNADLIIKNPILAVELPPKEYKRRDNYLTLPDVDKFIRAAKGDDEFKDAARDNKKFIIFVFAIFTGLRQGEVFALTHEDVDLEKSVIYVNKSVNQFKHDGKRQFFLGNVKTASSVREIPILNELKPFILENIKYEKEKHLRMGVPFSKKSIFFSSIYCGYQNKSAINNRLQVYQQNLGIQQTVSFHGLRHTFCTLLAEMGVPLKDASVLMGHANISLTAKVYTHISEAGLKKSIDRLSGVFDKTP